MIRQVIFDWKRTLYDPDTQLLIEGALEVLDLLKQKEIPMVLIGKGKEEMLGEVDRLGVKPYFETILFVGEEKNVHIFAPYIDAKYPEATVLVGDRVRSELEIGNKLGATTIWVKQGKFATELPLRLEQEPKITVPSLKELKQTFLDFWN